MATSLPADATKANSDASTDDPKQAILTDLTGVVDKFNSLKGALGAGAQLNLGDGLETVAQPGGTPDDIRVKLQGVSALARASTGIAVDVAGQTALSGAADDDQFLIWDTSAGAFKKLAASALVQVPRGYIDGFQTVRNAVDAQNLDVGVGLARNDADDGAIELASAITKRLDATFVAGSGNGMLDTGAIAASTWYHVFTIKNPTSAAVDVLASTSIASPTLPTGFTKKRRIWSVLTDGTPNIVPYSQFGDRCDWLDMHTDVNTTNPGSSAISRTLTVPTGYPVLAIFNVNIEDTAGATNAILFSALDTTDELPSLSAPPAGNAGQVVTGEDWFGELIVRTNSSAQIRSRFSVGGAAKMRISTRGYIDPRGKDA